jgi:hypothetical protein
MPRLFLLAVAVALVQTAFATSWQRYVITPNFLPASSQPLPYQALDFGSSLGTFLISPVLLFYAFYRMGKGLDLSFLWKSITGSVFLGGVAATILGLLMDIALWSGGDLANISATLSSEFGNAWNLSSLTLNCVEEGLYSTFVAVTAIFFFDYRMKNAERDDSEAEPVESDTGLQLPEGTE